MRITLGYAREALSDFAGKKGKCASTEETRLFVLEVVERLLHRGAHNNIKKWCFWTCNSCFTAPEDLETIVKVKINGYPEFAYTKWFSYYDTPSNVDFEGCEGGTGVIEEPGEFATAYDLPECGAYIGVLPDCKEAETNTHVIIQGKDHNSKEVYVRHNGADIHGELVRISRDNPARSITRFSSISSILKTKTNSHVQIRAIIPETNEQRFLAEYKPTDLNPSYRRFRVPGIKKDCCAHINVLGRIRLLDMHHDNDILPITSLSSLKKMAEMMQAETNDSVQTATFKSQLVDRLIDDENYYKRTNDTSIDVVYHVSPGSLEVL